MRPSWVAALILVLTVALVIASLHPRWADPIEMQVADQDGRPLANVNAVATWQLKGGAEGGNSHGALMVLEAITDDQGSFRIPGWGPKVPNVRQLLAISGLRDTQPELFLFKPGYRPVQLSNDRTRDGSTYFVRRFSGNGERVAMESVKGTSEEQRREIWHLALSMEHLFDDEAPCAWRSIPKMFAAIQKQNRAFEAVGVKGQLLVGVLVSNEQWFAERGCGSAAQFMGEIERGQQ